MDSRTPSPNIVRKRPLSDFYSVQPKRKISDEAERAHSERPPKRKQARVLRISDDDDEDEDLGGSKKDPTFSFRVLMPNGTTLEMKIRNPGSEMSIDKLVEAVKAEYIAVMGRTELSQRRQINWRSQNLYILDPFDRKIKGMDFRKLNPRKSYMLRLHDGSGEPDIFENMWDLTPDTELLKELPEEYTLESALADLIDNSLQAIWSNQESERRLISVKMFKNKIQIFDTGPGMDGSAENSIAKWGKMGASLHRSSKGKAIGCKPPYLKPYFGMFGYGGPIASMHLGRKAIVSSKTKESKKVYILHLERDGLLSSSSSEKTWRINGGLREPLDYEIQESPHGSFTKVEILEPKMRIKDIMKLKGKLKDIYFPYIQCDEMSKTGRTIMPTEFQVNETNLAEILDGEVAITNLFSCNGPDFTFELHFTSDNSSIGGVGQANARLKCVYFPVTQGEESIERILEKLKDEGFEILESFESFSRVSIRRLGRLLPDAHWPRLPFMEPKPRKGETLRRCWFRVKCFVDTDAGFNPTPAKTNLAQANPFTIALKNFGTKPSEGDAHVTISKDGKELPLSQLEKQYHEWILKMHDKYDCEIESGCDQPTIVLGSINKKDLGTSSDVLRVHKIIQRKGITWKSGQKIKVLKGACAGFHNRNTFATLEYIILEGCDEGDGGDARIICRSLEVPTEDGCSLSLDKGSAHIDLRGSKSLPLSVIDSGKCVPVDDAEWECQLQKYQHKVTPSSIELLDSKCGLDLEVDEILPDDVVDAGHDPPVEILSIVRPTSFNSAVASQKLDQKYILKENFEMILSIKFSASDKNDKNDHVYSIRMKPSSHKGLRGVYVFPLRRKLPDLFHKAGVYSFIFSLKETTCATVEKQVRVQALSEVGSWGLSSKNSTKYRTRVGAPFPCIEIACYDRCKNRIPFKLISDVVIKLHSERGSFVYDYGMDAFLSKDNFTLKIKGLVIDTSELDKIGPSYETTLSISSKNELFSVDIQVQVLPGPPHHISIYPLNFGQKLFPGLVLKELKLEIFDESDNHIQKDEQIQLQMDEFRAHDQGCLFCKVDASGCVNLGGLLKVTAGYGKKASLSVLSGNQEIFKKEYQIETRELRVASKIPERCVPGSHLENIIFEVINSEGEVDESIHDDDKNGQSHTLAIESELLNIDDTLRYSFHHGRCTVRAISLPEDEGKFHFRAVHSRHKELQLCIEVNTKRAVNLDSGSLQSQSPEIRIFKEVEVENFHFQSPQKPIFVYENPSPCEVPKWERGEVCHQYSDISMQDFTDSRGPESQVDCIDNRKLLEDEVLHYAQLCGLCEKNLQVLDSKQSNIKQYILNMEESMGLYSSQSSCCTRESIMDQIYGTGDSAAAVVCKVTEPPLSIELNQGFAKEILGVVALLGFADSYELSRILAEYLGEKQMLAVVCKAHAAIGATKLYEKNGHFNSAAVFSALADHLGISINGGYDMICLDNIRPYEGKLSIDPQRKLEIAKPKLPNGESPPGFLGYAVNMITISANHLKYRTNSGHGLRETLFYRLLGDLQVYTNRDCMNLASACIKDNATVSLDGVIMRGNGITSLVFEDPSIMFPVLSSEQRLTNVNPEVLNLLSSKRKQLREVEDDIKNEKMAYEEIHKKFYCSQDAYMKLLNPQDVSVG